MKRDKMALPDKYITNVYMERDKMLAIVKQSVIAASNMHNLGYKARLLTQLV